MPRNDDWMSNVGFFGGFAPPLRPVSIPVQREPQFEWYGREGGEVVGGPDYNREPRRIFVDKTTHRIHFQEETESSVVIVIEPKEGV